MTLSATDLDPDAVVVEHLGRRFGAHVAVHDVDLRVRRGEVFGLVGPNGAGKTTLIRMLCGIQRPTSGRACVLGFDVERDRQEVQQHLGYMSQAFSLYRELTVAESLRFYSDVYGGVSPAQVDSVCRALGLSRSDRDTVAGQLATGIRQRAALAAAVLHRPALLVLDEPTSGVDPVGRHDLWALMRSMAADGTTIIVTTHLMTEAERCDRVALMARGEVLTIGPPSELRAAIPLRVLVVRAEPWAAAYDALKRAWPDTSLQATTARVPVGDSTNIDDVEECLRNVRVVSIDVEPPSFDDAFVWYVRRFGSVPMPPGSP
jgi:ABC-2 type transport system ATP-binding protein